MGRIGDDADVSTTSQDGGTNQTFDRDRQVAAPGGRILFLKME